MLTVSLRRFVAKGNDGNYLQHSIEVEVAKQLASGDGAGRLHIAFAHGMAPFERCEQPKKPPARALLWGALNESNNDPKLRELSIVVAYRRTQATLNRYPNSAELLRAVIGSDRLSGGITETDPTKSGPLASAWASSRVKVANASWRAQIEPDAALACPADLETPWLVTLDPMTYVEAGDQDDDCVHRADRDPLVTLLRPYIETGHPGMAAIFVYSVRPDVRRRFWHFVNDLAKCLDVNLVACWLTHRGGNRNLGALLCSRFAYSLLPPGVRAGQE
jgi:hypothetical protein